MSNIVIRPAAVTDFASIASLVSDLGYPTSPSQMQRRLDAITQRIHTLRAKGRSERMVGLQTAQLRRQQQRHDALLHDLAARSGAGLSVEHMAVCLVDVS